MELDEQPINMRVWWNWQTPRTLIDNILYMLYSNFMWRLYNMIKKFDENEFISICRNSLTMAEAARKLGMHFNTFRRYATKLGCYNPNQSGKGVNKVSRERLSTKDILAGKYPEYNTYKLKKRLIREGIIKDECFLCGWKEKRLPTDEFTPCELHHKDGNPRNHLEDNLILLCPNCHSLQNYYRSKNRAGS